MTTASETMTRDVRKTGRRARLAEWADGRLNPFFVKDVRAWLRSRKFLIIFFSALSVCQVVTIMVIARGEKGSNLFSALVAGLAMVLVGVVPYLMQDKFADELASGSTELALISRMTPGRMVRGKIASGLVANLLFFSAVGPSLLIAYMLGGVHPFTMIYSIVAVLALSTFSMVLAILMVSIMGRKPVKVFSLGLFAAGLAAAVMMIALSEMASRNRLFEQDEFWVVNLFIAGHALLGGLFFHNVAASRLSFASANRDLRPRLTLSIWTLLSLLIAWGATFADAYLGSWVKDADDIAEVSIVLATLIFTIGFFFITGTPAELSRRLVKHSPANLLTRTLLLPGPGRLFAYVLVHFTLIFGTAVLYWRSASHRYDIVSFPAFVFAGYYLITGCYLVYRLINRLFFRRRPASASRAMLVIAVVWVAWGIFLAALFGRSAGPVLLLSPSSAFYYVVEASRSDEPIHLFWMIVGTAPCWAWATISWLQRLSREMAELRIAELATAADTPETDTPEAAPEASPGTEPADDGERDGAEGDHG